MIIEIYGGVLGGEKIEEVNKINTFVNFNEESSPFRHYLYESHNKIYS